MSVGPPCGRKPILDFSPGGKARVIALSAVGTICCIVVAFAFDSYAWDSGEWRWGDEPLNNLIIPLLLAPPFFVYLLNKQRQLAIAHGELMVLAATDPLTSCLNRRAFTALVDGYLDRIQSQEAPAEAALLIIDVDHFKAVNDTYGHDCGDTALVAIAATIRSSVREFDVVGRMGGEEFSVLLPSISADRAVLVAEQIRNRISHTELMLAGKPCRLSVSIGGAIFARDATFSDAYRHADQQLYAAKQGGRNRSNIAVLTAADSMPVH